MVLGGIINGGRLVDFFFPAESRRWTLGCRSLVAGCWSLLQALRFRVGGTSGRAGRGPAQGRARPEQAQCTQTLHHSGGCTLTPQRGRVRRSLSGRARTARRRRWASTRHRTAGQGGPSRSSRPSPRLVRCFFRLFTCLGDGMDSPGLACSWPTLQQSAMRPSLHPFPDKKDLLSRLRGAARRQPMSRFTIPLPRHASSAQAPTEVDIRAVKFLSCRVNVPLHAICSLRVDVSAREKTRGCERGKALEAKRCGGQQHAIQHSA